MSLGIQEVKDVLVLGIRLGEIVDALSDGVGISDIGAAIRLAKSVKPAMDALSGGQLLPEFKDLDDAEKQELKDFCVSELDLRDDGLEDVIEKALLVVIDLSGLLK